MKKTFIKFRIVILLLVVAICISCVLFFYPFNSSKQIHNVLLISIDTCRADYLSCYGYSRKTTPNIDAVATEGFLFENVISPIPITLPAHASMLTGTIPPYHSVHGNINYQLGQFNVTLAEILKEAGFATAAAISAIVLDAQFGTAQGFDTYNDDFENTVEGGSVKQRRGDETTDIAINWLQKNKEKKFFYFLHYYDPHFDYVPPEPFASIFVTNPYAGEIAYTDYCIGRVVAKLKELDIYDSTLIIITSDHGEMLGEHGERSHGYYIYQSSIKVPLIFKLPGKHKPKRITNIAGLIDIVPTVCSLLDIKPPPEVQGIDILHNIGKNIPPQESRNIYCQCLQPTKYNGNSLLGVVTDRFKYIQTTRPELYDMIKDQAEKTNLIDEQPQQARILKDKLAQIIERSVRKDSANSKMELDEETQKQLESLGYVGESVIENFEFDQSKDDPKDLMDFHLLNIDTIAFLSQEQYELAKPLAKRLIQQRPDCAIGYKKMGKIALELKDYPQAIINCQKAIELDPFDVASYNHLGLTFKALGKFDEAIKNYRQALEVKPDSADVYTNMGGTFVMQGKKNAAVDCFLRALQIKPDYTSALNNLGIVFVSQGKPDKAIGQYQKAIKIDPNFHKSHYNLANVLITQGKNDQAIHHYHRALEINPNLTEAHVGNFIKIASMLIKDKKTQQAIMLFKLVLKNKPDNFRVHYNLGIMLTMTGKITESIKHFRKAVSLQPDNPKSLNSLAWVLATNPESTSQDADEAVKFAQQAVDLTDRQKAQPLDTLAAAHAAAGDFAKAIEATEKALQLTDNDELTKEIKQRIKLYKAGQPYREPAEIQNDKL